MIQKVSRKLLSTMQVGETRVFTEAKKKRQNAGSEAASYAIRANIKITTKACLVFLPSEEATVKAVLVTRV